MTGGAAGRVLLGGQDAGSGFAITDSRVLTAGHVVRDAATVADGRDGEAAGAPGPLLAYVEDRGEPAGVPAVVAFQPEDGEPIAVIRIEVSTSLDVAVLHLQQVAPAVLSAPAHAAAEDRWRVETRPGRRDSYTLTGTVTDPNRRMWNEGRKPTTLIQLLVDQQVGDYKGYSGSPVIAAPAGGVLGVLVEQGRWRTSPQLGQPPPVANVLFAAPIEGVLAEFDLAGARWSQLNALLPGSLELDPEFVQHFEPRSRGVQRASQRGWFFTGRTVALTELAAWLASDDDTSRVVTGSPGSGKSAVLSRLVVCSDPALRALLPAADLAKAAPQTLPPLGSIDVAVHATGKTTEQVAAQIAAALDLKVAPALLPAVLAERDESVTIAIDALDEAAFREDLVLKLVQPLVAEGVRLLLGARRDLLPLLRTGIVPLDLDDEAYFEVSDIATYVAAYLRGAPGEPRRPNPYLGSASDLPEMIGTAVADSAAGNFLIAQLVALELVSRAQPVDPRRRDWDAFPSRVGDAMRIYLEAVGASVPGGYRWVRDLLAPLAYAEGTDLDDQLWADLATELGGDDYDKGDLRRLRADTGAAALLTPAGTGWRLFHQALAEYLREELGRGGVTEYEAHRTIASCLLAEVPDGEAERRWWEAAPYVLTNLGRHAVGGGLLEDLVLDPGFLLWGDQDRQLPLLGRVHRPAARAAADCYQLAAHEIGASGAPEDAATVLHITAQLRGADEFAARIARLRPEGWSVAWRDWRPSVTHRVLLGHGGSVTAVAMGTAHGRAVAVTGGSDGVTVVWDLETGAVLHPLAQTAEPTWFSPLAISALAAGDGVAVVGDNAGRVELWDLETGRPIRVINEEYSDVEGVALSGDPVCQADVRHLQ